MKGERLGWFLLASHLGKTVQEVQSSVTSSEFVEWMVFLRRDQTTPKLEHYYLAQIAKEVRSVLAKNPNSIKIEHFILKFHDQVNTQQDNLSPEERLAISKNFWMAATGYKRVANRQNKEPK